MRLPISTLPARLTLGAGVPRVRNVRCDRTLAEIGSTLSGIRERLATVASPAARDIPVRRGTCASLHIAAWAARRAARAEPLLRSAWLTCFLLALAAPAASAVDLKEFPELAAFVDEMSERHRFSRSQLARLFDGVTLRPEVVEAIERPREALPWHEYKTGFLTERHVRRGARFWREHAEVLERANAEFGVPPQIVVAILGIETHYGRNTGGFRVIDALTTQMLRFTRRAPFFRRELEEFLLLTREERIDPLTVRGSYAGAIGIPQFIPSSYRRYAVDFSGDQRRNLIRSVPDAIGSVANFLKSHGWEADAPVSDDVHIEGTLFYWIEKLGVKPILSVNEFNAYGIFPVRHNDPYRRAALIALEGESGPLYRIGYDNFYVITRYNRSKRYAMAVYELSEMIRARYENGS